MSWAVAALGMLAGGALAATVFGAGSPFTWAAAAELGLVGIVATWLEVEVPARRIAWLAFAVALASATIPVWQGAALVGLIAFFTAGLLRPELRVREGWVLGTVPVHTALVAAVTPVALVGWAWTARPDLQALLEMYVPPIPIALLWVGAVGFAVANAILEELIWRGVFHSQLRALGGAGVAVVVGAVSFGLQHANGLPSGPVGIALVTGWGVLLGWLRERAGGLLAPVLAHLIADLVCAWLVLALLT